MEAKRTCCQSECNKDAQHSIQYSSAYEDYSDFCSGHVSEFLPPDKEVYVYPINQQ